MLTLPIIAIGSLGGTIAMTPGEGGGVRPALDASQLVAAVPELGKLVHIQTKAIANVASPAIKFGDLIDALDFAREAVDNGASGVVLTHGTDTLEESAYFLDLLWDRPEPLILTGAMRPASMPGADGPGNIYAATVAAAEPRLRGYGVLVVMNDEVHLARTVAKTHANAVWTFLSRDWGPVARIVEGRARVMFVPAQERRVLPLAELSPMRIPILEIGLEDDGAYVHAVMNRGISGLIIAGSGVGHATLAVLDEAEKLIAEGVPVILATRQGAGTVCRHSYDYPGAEMDAIRRGLIPAGYLSPRKARVLLWMLTSLGFSLDEIEREFRLRGE